MTDAPTPATTERPIAGTDSVERASYSDDGVYRWWCERRWDDRPLLCWIGLNPGTGDTDGKPRPTLRRVEALARSSDLGGVLIVNLFAYRSTDPKALRTAGVDIVGEHNDAVLRWAHGEAASTLAAWGAGGRLHGRGRHVASRLGDATCLGMTKHGEPRHPLYVPVAVEPMPFLRPAI